MVSLALEIEMNMGRTWPELSFGQSIKVVGESFIDDYKKIVRICVDCRDRLVFGLNAKPVDETIVAPDGSIVRDQSVRLLNAWANDIKLEMNVLLHLAKYTPVYRQDVIEYCETNGITLDDQLHQFEFFHAFCCEISWNAGFWKTYEHTRKTILRPVLSDSNQQNFVGYDDNNLKSLLSTLKSKLYQ